MEDQSILDKTNGSTDYEYINECIKEVCLNGDSLSKYQKLIEKKFDEDFYQKCNNFVEEVKRSVERKKFTHTSVVNLKYLARQIAVSNATVDAVVKHFTDKSEKEELRKQAAKKKKQEEVRRKAEEEAKKAREEAERKKKDEEEKRNKKIAAFIRRLDEEWLSLLSYEYSGFQNCLKYQLLDINTMSVAVALNRHDRNKEIHIPPYTKYDRLNFTVSSIIDYAFFECLWLESVIIPSTVKAIGRGAFLNCYNLSKITIEGDRVFAFGNSFQGTPFEKSSAYSDALKQGKIVMIPETNIIELPRKLPPYLRYVLTQHHNNDDASWEILPETSPAITPLELVIPAQIGKHRITI